MEWLEFLKQNGPLVMLFVLAPVAWGIAMWLDWREERKFREEWKREFGKEFDE